MSQENIPLNIIEFWDWFQRNEYMFREIIDAQHAVDTLNEQVLAFGLFSWEIGEGKNRPHYLAISPNGDKGRLQLSKKIIAAAPKVADWEFHFCKQPKINWDFTFEAYDRFMAKHTFDASGWDYMLKKNEEGNIEIVVCTDNLNIMDIDDELNAVDLVVTNILGEELIIHHLDAIETVDEFEPEAITDTYKMPTLKLYFEKILS